VSSTVLSILYTRPWQVRTTAWQVSTKCQIFPIKSVRYNKVNKVENLLENIDSVVYSDVLLTVHTLANGMKCILWWYWRATIIYCQCTSKYVRYKFLCHNYFLCQFWYVAEWTWPHKGRHFSLAHEIFHKLKPSEKTKEGNTSASPPPRLLFGMLAPKRAILFIIR
jgi:hypothetical protein